MVLVGRNGAGKSRVLRELAAALGAEGLLIDLHHLCEQALSALRSRGDVASLREEVDPIGPSDERVSDVCRVVGRDYDEVEWYALDLGLGDPEADERFKWSSDVTLVPDFHVRYRSMSYSASDMGLGEFSVHFLFWILEQYRDTTPLVLLLDEPDAFLPPLGISSLLARVLQLCLVRGWQLVIATHSEEMIAAGMDSGAITLLRSDGSGIISVSRSADDPHVGRELLSRPPVEHQFYCEDESARYLLEAILSAGDRGLAQTVSIVWGNGEGYMRGVQRHLPRPPRAEITFAFAYDGDQRGKVATVERWPTLYLPTERDPDTLFRELDARRGALAAALGVNPLELVEFLDSLEGLNAHDWVNDLSARYGRDHVLRVLARLWVEDHADHVAEFVRQLTHSGLFSGVP